MSFKVLDDPRDVQLETKEVLPYTWYGDDLAESFGTSGMFLAGLIMISRNRNIAWAAIIFGISGLINSHPLRSKNGAGGPMSSFFMCITAFIALYFPFFFITKPIPT